MLYDTSKYFIELEIWTVAVVAGPLKSGRSADGPSFVMVRTAEMLKFPRTK